jgi:hypothetical protein
MIILVRKLYHRLTHGIGFIDSRAIKKQIDVMGQKNRAIGECTVRNGGYIWFWGLFNS